MLFLRISHSGGGSTPMLRAAQRQVPLPDWESRACW